MVKREDLIVWSDATANSSRTRVAIASLLGGRLEDGNASLVDDVIRTISARINSGSEHSAPVAALLQVLYCSLIVIGIIINLCVWFIFIRKPKLRTARNIYIVNLCTSDILLCGIAMPFTLIFLLEAKWTLGLYLCKLVPLIQCSNILVSTGTVVIIAMDRYNTIVKSPCACPRRLPALVYIVCLWAVSLAASSPMWIFNQVEPVLFPSWPDRTAIFLLYEICMEQWPTPQWRLAFTVGILLVQYLAPILTLAVTHARIKTFLRQHMANGSIGNRIKAEIQRNRRVTQVLTLIVVVYAVSWLPYHLFLLLDELKFIDVRTPTYSLGFAGCHLLAMTSAVTNPVLYGFLNTNFQREWRLLLRQCRGHPTPAAEPSAAATNTVRMTVHRPEPSGTAISMLTAQRLAQPVTTSVTLVPAADAESTCKNETQL